MSTITEIEAAISKLPAEQVEVLAQWLETFRQQNYNSANIVDWLTTATGAAKSGMSTDEILETTRGE